MVAVFGCCLGLVGAGDTGYTSPKLNLRVYWDNLFGWIWVFLFGVWLAEFESLLRQLVSSRVFENCMNWLKGVLFAGYRWGNELFLLSRNTNCCTPSTSACCAVANLSLINSRTEFVASFTTPSPYLLPHSALLYHVIPPHDYRRCPRSTQFFNYCCHSAQFNCCCHSAQFNYCGHSAQFNYCVILRSKPTTSTFWTEPQSNFWWYSPFPSDRAKFSVYFVLLPNEQRWSVKIPRSYLHKSVRESS